jgi:hypothetical protein
MANQHLSRAAVALGALAALAAAGCGGGGSPEPRGSMSAQQIRGAWLAYSDCVRHHGVPNFPDIRVDDTGHVVADDNDGPRVPDGAIQACQSLVAAVPQWSQETPPPPADVLAKLRQYTQCMRRNGHPEWPDPAADGSFTLAAGQDAKQILSQQPEQCQAFVPAGGLHVRPG